MDYYFLKLVHIISSTILFGTGIGSAFYMFMANRRGELHGIHFAVRHVVIADYIFTTPTIIIQLLSGLLLLEVTGYSISDYWVSSALYLYFFAGACWLPVVWIQIKMRNMAKKALEDGSDLPHSYWIMDKWWITLGSLAFPALVIIFYLMVFKPV